MEKLNLFRTSGQPQNTKPYIQNNRMERAFKFILIQPCNFRDEEKETQGGIT